VKIYDEGLFLPLIAIDNYLPHPPLSPVFGMGSHALFSNPSFIESGRFQNSRAISLRVGTEGKRRVTAISACLGSDASIADFSLIRSSFSTIELVD
jgi:hypothetical protein